MEKAALRLRVLSAPLATALAVAALTSTGCSTEKRMWLKGVSQTERLALAENPFSPESQMTDVTFADDATYPANEPGAETDSSGNPLFIRRCDPARYERELEDALRRAAADPDRKTVVVRYSVSFGTPVDWTANLAHHRTILRTDDDGVTPVPVAPSDSLDWNDYAGTRAYHYYGDHRPAKADYLSGARCFFNVMKLPSGEAGAVLTRNGSPQHQLPGDAPASVGYDHTQALLYYGDAYSCTTDECWRRKLSPRLFKTADLAAVDYANTLVRWRDNSPSGNPTNLKLSAFIDQCAADTQAQLLPLYVADIREDVIGLPDLAGRILNATFASSAVRRYEYAVSYRKIMHLDTLFTNRRRIQRAMETPRTVAGLRFSGIVGAAQLIDNLIFSGVNGTVLSTQYTPIVLDLPESARGIRTSSASWGTFFNLANLIWHKLDGTTAGVDHLTAWLGGEITRTLDSGGRPTFEQSASDAFLVAPTPKLSRRTGLPILCDDGSPQYDIVAGTDLFGSHARVGGALVEYDHGFHNLREWANRVAPGSKSCDPTGLSAEDSVRKRYLGPWDAAFDRLRVWTDRNRDGRFQCGEIQSLPAARIAAINTCNVVFETNVRGQTQPLMDRFGNRTHLRAAFLVADDATRMTEAEAIARIRSGAKTGGGGAEFRVAIDILFNTRTGMYLQDAVLDEIENPSAPPVLIH